MQGLPMTNKYFRKAMVLYQLFISTTAKETLNQDI